MSNHSIAYENGKFVIARKELVIYCKFSVACLIMEAIFGESNIYKWCTVLLIIVYDSTAICQVAKLCQYFNYQLG